MTQNETKVWIVIQRHKGEANAIGQKDLARAVGMSERKVRDVVGLLIVERGCMIASCCAPGGYFVPQTQKEINAAFNRLRHHAVKMLQRAAALKKFDLTNIQRQLFDV